MQSEEVLQRAGATAGASVMSSSTALSQRLQSATPRKG